MDSKSQIYASPSFNTHSSNNIADIADRVVQELRSQNGFHNDTTFSFSDDAGDRNKHEVNTHSHTETVNQTPVNEQEFEFPVMCGDITLTPISTDESISDERCIQIAQRYPLFDRSLLYNHVDGTPKTDSKPPASRRSSLKKLFNEDLDNASTSPSNSSSDELDGIAPGTYCVWKPKTEPSPRPRGKHKKSNSISVANSNESNQWKVRDLLKRSYSDDGYSTGKESPVFLFIPPISPNQKTNNEKVIKIQKKGKVGSSKTEKRIPAYKSRIGNIGAQPYLPYRQDQVAAFANFAGANRNMYRY